MVSKKPINPRTKVTGKKAVYITQYRNAALEVMKMYERKGENVTIEAEHDSTGAPVFVVYVLPRGPVF